MVALASAGLIGLIAAALDAIPAGAADAISSAERSKIESVVHDYLMQHPEVVLDALKELDRKEQEAAAVQAKDVIRKEHQTLTRDGAAGVIGNPKGDVSVVEFFDYNCGYCRLVADEVKALVKSDPNVRVVLHEWPIRGPGSVGAAKVSLAASKQKNFAAFHFALLATDGTVDEARALAVAKEQGLDMAQLARDMKAQNAAPILSKTEDLTHRLGLSGTPGFIIGDTLIGGATSLDNLKKTVAEARAACKKDPIC